jgi:hypothetical protein
MKTYRVRLTADERQALEALVTKGRAAARKLTRARILLKADEGPPDGAERPPDAAAPPPSGWTDVAIAAALDVGRATVERVRQRAVVEGPLAALERRPSTAAPRRRLDGRGEAQLIALACGAAPEGHEGWSLRLLAEKMVECEYVDALSYETVRRIFKKTNSSPT